MVSWRGRTRGHGHRGLIGCDRPGRASRAGGYAWKLIAGSLVAGGLVVSAASVAFGQGTLTVTPDTNLVNGSIVTVSASGLPANTFGYIIECNLTPKEPTVSLGSPVFGSLPVGCSPPTLKVITSTSGTGTFSTTYKVLISRKVGPPCGFNRTHAACPSSDSAGKSPALDAQNYTCPPTPEEQVEGVRCDLIFIDAMQARVMTPIVFSGAGPATKSTGGTGGTGGSTTTVPKSTTTTVATKAVTSPTTATTATTAPKVAPVTASSGQLAFTGVGTSLRLLMLVGIALAGLGLLLWLASLWWVLAGRRLKR